MSHEMKEELDKENPPVPSDDGTKGSDEVADLEKELEALSEEQALLQAWKQQESQWNRKLQTLFEEQEKMAATLERLTKKPADGIYTALTFHGTEMFLDKNGKLRHRKQNKETPTSDGAVYVVVRATSFALIARMKGALFYVKGMDKDGLAKTDRKEAWMEVGTEMAGSISIRFGEGFLSAKPDGSFCFSENNRGWEHFRLRDCLIPLLMGMEEHMEDIYARYIFPWEAVKPGSRIVIYGGGNVGKIYLRQLARSSYCTLVAVCDKKPEGTGIHETPVINVQELSRMDAGMYDLILVAEEKKKTAMEILEELDLTGLDTEKIKWIDPMRK